MLSRSSRAAGASVAILGLGVLVGWAMDISLLKTALPGLVAMKPNTALGLVLLGTSIALRVAPSRRGRRPLWLVAAALAALIGAASLAEYVTGWDAGIDQLLFRDLDPDPRSAVPGRMAPGSAIELILLGTALVLLDARGSARRTGEALALVAGWLAGVAAIGYVLGAAELYSSLAFSAMALHTSVAFAVAAAAALTSEPTVGLAEVLTLDSAGGQTARQLMPFALLAPLAVAALVHLGGTRDLYRPEIELALASAVGAFSLSAVVWATATRIDNSERRRRHAETVALTDPLTRLANRRGLEAALAELRPGTGHDDPYSVIVADLDGLKRINDERGHAAGDEALLRVAAVLRLATRPTDVAARVGGDEYVVLLPKTDADGAHRIVARVTDLLGEELSDDGATGVSVRMGTATWAPGDDSAAVLARADRAMYDEKRAKERAQTAGIPPRDTGLSDPLGRRRRGSNPR